MADYKQHVHSFPCEVAVNNKMNNVLFLKGNWNLHILCIFPEIYYKANNSDILIWPSNEMVLPEAWCSQSPYHSSVRWLTCPNNYFFIERTEFKYQSEPRKIHKFNI